MNREIIFRAWDDSNKEMINPYCELKENRFWGEDLTNTGLNTPISVMQFTGLYDKNGTKIFEGDILSIKEFWNTAMDLSYEERDLFEINDLKGDLHDEYITDVIYEPGCFLIKTKPDDYDCFASVLDGNQKHSQPIFDCEIIGNTHENYELLNTSF